MHSYAITTQSKLTPTAAYENEHVEDAIRRLNVYQVTHAQLHQSNAHARGYLFEPAHAHKSSPMFHYTFHHPDMCVRVDHERQRRVQRCNCRMGCMQPTLRLMPRSQEHLHKR